MGERDIAPPNLEDSHYVRAQCRPQSGATG